MSDLELAIKEVAQKVMEEPVVKEFLNVKNQIENDEDLIELEKSMKEHQKLMVQYASNEEKASIERSLYHKDKEEFENHPLIKNYNALKEEVEDLLQEIKEILS